MPTPEATAPGEGVLLSLASLPAEAMVTEAALARALAVSPRTVRAMVARGELPPGLALGGKKVWLAGKVLRWIAEAAEGEERKARQDLLGIRRLHP